MLQDIKIIDFGVVNSYLIQNDTGWIMVDTGIRRKRSALLRELEATGCKPGSLKLIILTHGDYDHAGNAAFLRKNYRTKIAMHQDESAVVEKGDMVLSRNNRPLFSKTISRIMLKVILPFMRFGKFERFKPDLFIGDGYDLSAYGIEAKILYLPGHSSGSIGILTADGNLFCGDFVINGDKPGLNYITADPVAANTSIEKLRNLKINTVYPGHGKPFPMESFIKEIDKSN